jgi:ElaA protein
MFGAMNPARIVTTPAATLATSPKVRWQWSRFEDLAPAELYAALAARQQVFTVEQHCAFQDADGHDPHAWHLFAWADKPSTPVLAGYLRVLDPGRKFSEPSIGRVLTVPPWRGIGFGRTVMAEGIVRTHRAWPGQPVRIAAQQRLERFYAGLGFRRAGLPYQEDDIAHVDMLLPAPA